MEPVQKKAKITGHFRVALKPQDVNVHPHLKKNKRACDLGKENIEVITINDDEEEDSIKQQTHQQQITRQSPKAEALKVTDDVSSQITSNKFEERHSKLGYSYNNIHIPTSPINKYIGPPGLPANVVDPDKLLLNDVRFEPHYAWDSFQYDKERELKFRNRKYLDDKHLNHQITPYIRARLVDWLVQIQDLFRLNHESIYMAVKLADQYLMRKTVPKKNLQLLYLTTILISAKFEDRIPPFDIKDLVKQSVKIYCEQEVISLEVDILSTLDFDIGFPLSYGFLRRYARCTRSDITTLTLARYILESSLLDYEMIEELESKMAAASLLLAFEMRDIDGAWDEAAEFYTGYKQEELYALQTRLNDMISRPDDRTNAAIRTKYDHTVFLSVARIPPLSRN